MGHIILTVLMSFAKSLNCDIKRRKRRRGKKKEKRREGKEGKGREG